MSVMLTLFSYLHADGSPSLENVVDCSAEYNRKTRGMAKSGRRDLLIC